MTTSPTPQEIRKARGSLTQTQAAELVFKSLRTWQNWEAPIGSLAHRKMCKAIYEYFLIVKDRQI